MHQQNNKAQQQANQTITAIDFRVYVSQQNAHTLKQMHTQRVCPNSSTLLSTTPPKPHPTPRPHETIPPTPENQTIAKQTINHSTNRKNLRSQFK